MIPDATLTSFVFCVATLRDSLSCRVVVRSENMGEGSNPGPFEKDVFVSIPEIWGVGGFFLSFPTALSYLVLATQLASYREA